MENGAAADAGGKTAGLKDGAWKSRQLFPTEGGRYQALCVKYRANFSVIRYRSVLLNVMLRIRP